MPWLAIVVVIFAVIAAGAIYQIAGTEHDARSIAAPGQMVDIGPGTRLHVRVRGDGAPSVIFEAGIAASSLSWARVQPAVAKFTTTCSYDRAGLAWSAPIPGRVTAGRLADQLSAVLNTAAIPGPYVLVGHSFGGFVVQLFAARYPERVAGLVLVDPIFPSEFLVMSARARRRLKGGVLLSRVGGVLAGLGVVRACLNLLASGSPDVPRRVARLFGAEAATVLGRLVGEVRKLPPDVWPAVRSHWSQPKCFTSMARHLGGLRSSAREVLGAVVPPAIPVTVITAGSQPESCRIEHARIAARSIRGRHIVSEKSGHWILLDEPDLVVQAISDVLAAATRGPDPSNFRR